MQHSMEFFEDGYQDELNEEDGKGEQDGRGLSR